MAVNPDKNAVEQGLIARLIGKIKRIALDISDDVSAEETRAMAAEAAAKTVVTAGENCSVTKTTAEDGHDVYTVNADGKPQVQADWNQADSSKVDYIKNKPNLSAVATSGDYNDLTNKPNLELKEDVSNKAQTLDTASTTDYPSSKAVADFVNSSIATNTANFLGTYDVVNDLGLTTSATNAQIATALGSYQFSTAPTNNDYVFASIDLFITTDADEYRRFKFNGTTWNYEYTLNNSSFTQAQWNAINSGIDSSDKTIWNNHVSNTNNPHNVTTSQIGAEPAFTVLPISKGGTGYNNAPQAASNLLYNLSPATADIESDDSVFISGNAYQGATDTFFKRPVSALWTYLRNKISSVLGLTASKYNGTADTAVKLPLAWGGFDVQQGYRLLANITAPGAWNDRICSFNVFEMKASQSDPVGQCGILTVQIRNSNNTFSYGITYNRSASNKLDIVARSNTDKSISLYAYSTGNIYGGLQLELVSSSNYTGNPTGCEGITLYNNNSLQSTVTGDTVTINNPITYLEDDSVTADKVKDNETLPVNITGYASHLRQAKCRFLLSETGYRLMAELSPSINNYADTCYIFNIYETLDQSELTSGILKGVLSIRIRRDNSMYRYSSAYKGSALEYIGLDLRVDPNTNGINLYATKSGNVYAFTVFELLNDYDQYGAALNPTLHVGSELLGSVSGTVVTPKFTLLKGSDGTIPLANNSGVGSPTRPVYVDENGLVQPCSTAQYYVAIADFTHTLTSGEVSNGYFEFTIDSSTTFMTGAGFNSIKKAACYNELILLQTSTTLNHDTVCYDISHIDYYVDSSSTGQYIRWPLIMGKNASNSAAKGLLSVPIVNYVTGSLNSIMIRVNLPQGMFTANDTIVIEYSATTIQGNS